MSLDSMLRDYKKCRTENGRERAKTILLRETRVVLLSYFRSRVARADAEDLAQAALKIINDEFDGFEPAGPRAFRSHVFTVAKNRLRTHSRQQGQRKRHVPVEWAVEPELPDILVWKERFDLLRAALALVRSTLRRAFESRLRGESARTLARREGIKTVSGRARIRRARIAVEMELEKLMATREPTR
ncbi:hypothetical protein ENSA5_67230 [Enhygromyxa salina]|uniref:RNA polymerase sigma-70 region 2 domain-containing protein n=1 Tax=Enhygromyxa salina TaxID=215803 RepID=A0A2S9XBZ1_9BACT|nr:sigma factor [Enhygromyxa salina]PRP90201.1 hypothetical protein ENSA5_67230 [Enhygromyxa salina]